MSQQIWSAAVALVLMSLFAGPVWSQDDAATERELPSRVERFVEQLDAPQRRLRQRAEDDLIELGPDILPFLPTPDPGMGIEASERLERVIERLKSVRTRAEVRRQTFRVDLSDVATLGDALEAISTASAIEFEHNLDEYRSVRPTAAPLEFWHAVDDVLDQMDLDINFYGSDPGTLLLVPREESRRSRVDSAAYTGVYRIEPTLITSRRNLIKNNLSGLNLTVELAWTPTTTPIGLTVPIDRLRATLDDGSDLPPQADAGDIEVATDESIAFSEFFLPLQLPAGNAKKIRSLSGVIRAMLPGTRHKFKLPLDEAAASEAKDAMTVTIDSVRPNGSLHEVRVDVSLESAGRSLESHRQWIFENDAYLVDSDDVRMDHLGFQVYRQSESGVGISYLFDVGDAPADYKMVYESPTAVINDEVEFLLQDIRLP